LGKSKNRGPGKKVSEGKKDMGGKRKPTEPRGRKAFLSIHRVHWHKGGDGKKLMSENFLEK